MHPDRKLQRHKEDWPPNPASSGPSTGVGPATCEVGTLEAGELGVMAIDRRGSVHYHNDKASQLLAPGGWRAGQRLMPEDANSANFVNGNGREVALTVHKMPSGDAVVLIEDVTETPGQFEAGYRTLFENSVYGIYRDTLDGRPIRVNPALAAINGYASEREHIDAVQARPVNWYVAEGRADEFHHILESHGRVSDFVSQIYRHRTGERVWITENAWYVYDLQGYPLFIEGTIQDATERIAAQAALTNLASIDTLTGAKSRYSFMRRLDEAALQSPGGFLLYCVDLDMFKDVNDIFGHAAGDAVLKAVAARLFDLVGEAGIVGRLGGDEFAILTEAPEYLADPETLARNAVQAMRLPVPVEGRNHYVGASVGVAMFPQHGATGEELLRNADTALYRVKSQGRNGWRMFDHELRDQLEHRKKLEGALRDAIEQNQLDLHYQPVVDAASGVTVGFEALMRWNHPELGSVPPADFIPVAEQAGLMTGLGSWAISQACEALAALPSPLKISVNVSANQFRAPGFYLHLKSELTRCGVAPGRLMLEITESVLVSNERVGRLLLAALRKLGVQIAIDDFGTGYSSLSYLQHFPINCVKIDRSFVAGMANQKANLAVIRAIIGIGRDLGIDIIAEGVETREQAKSLRSEGCDLLQGFLFSKPKPLTEAVADLAVSLLPRAAKQELVQTG